MNWRWIGQEALECWQGDTRLFRYVYRPDVPQTDSPRPYFHPLAALDGTVVTGYAPDDHRWHLGLSLAVPYVSGTSFWGGPTYIHGQGYVLLANHGVMQHDLWDQPQAESVTEHLDWISAEGNPLIREERTIHPEILSAQEWALHLTITLHNQTSADLEFVSPAGFGRTGAGYGGLFWRGSDAMREGTVATDQAQGEASVLGTRSEWLTYAAPDGTVRLHFSTQADSADAPPCWFVRASEYPGVCYALAFEERYRLPAGEHARFGYRIAVEHR